MSVTIATTRISIDPIRRRLGAPQCGRHLYTFEQVSSTNTPFDRLARAGPPPAPWCLRTDRPRGRQNTDAAGPRLVLSSVIDLYASALLRETSGAEPGARALLHRHPCGIRYLERVVQSRSGSSASLTPERRSSRYREGPGGGGGGGPAGGGGTPGGRAPLAGGGGAGGDKYAGWDPRGIGI
jgi:hypothetical protein